MTSSTDTAAARRQFDQAMAALDSDPATALRHFRDATKADHAFQVAFDLPYEDADCFAHSGPILVPARTFLSQLV